jgi:hypothetical protein
VLRRMLQRIEYHSNRTFPGDIDHTNYTAEDYCNIVKRDKWVQPFGYAPPPHEKESPDA